MITLQDQIGLKHTFDNFPKRIVSLVPSQTELLVDLDLENELAGITKFCIHPKHLKKSKTIIGGTKKVDFEKIKALQPDIIIANKEENTLEIVEELSKICPVWVTDIITIDDNTHSSGVSLHLTKKRRVYNVQINFFCWNEGNYL